MKVLIVHITLIAGVLFSCANKEYSESNGESARSENVSTNGNVTLDESPNSLMYNGERIELKRVPIDKQELTIQARKQERGNVVFEAQKIPTELYLRNRGLTGERLQTAMEDLKGEQLFYFDISDLGKQDLLKKNKSEDYEEAIKYLSFKIEQDFSILSGKDTLRPNYTQFEQSFHLTPYERILVSFSGENLDEPIQLVYKDQLFNKGTMHFQFAPEHVIMKKNAPLL